MNHTQKTPEQQQLFHLRLQTLMIFIILLLILAAVSFLLIKGNEIFTLVNRIDTGEINQAVSSLKTAADTLGSLDTEKLNAGIGDLSATAQNLSQLDFSKLEAFMDSLENLGNQMDAVSSFFGSFLRK